MEERLENDFLVQRKLYLALCPQDWPYQGGGSSCRYRGDSKMIRGPQVLSNPAHEGPSICASCWNPFNTRARLIQHLDMPHTRRPYYNKLNLIRAMYIQALRLPGLELFDQMVKATEEGNVDGAPCHEGQIPVRSEAQPQMQQQQYGRPPRHPPRSTPGWSSGLPR